MGMKIFDLCKDILSITPKIHCSAFINKNGRMTEFNLHKECKVKRLTRHELEILCMQCKLQSLMNKEFDDKMGQLDYTMICRESAMEFIFPCSDGIIFITTTKDAPIRRISRGIAEKIIKFKFGPSLENLQ